MKNKSLLQRILTGLFVVLVLAASNSIVRASCQSTCPSATWLGITNNSWFISTNWQPLCTPHSQTDASINNGGVALILPNAPDCPAAALSLMLGDQQGDSGSVTVDGTDVYGPAILDVFPQCIDPEHTYPGNIYIGNRGNGSLSITNGGMVQNGYAYIAAVANPTRPASNGNVTVKGSGTFWQLSGNECTGAGLFIGCTATSDTGGTALLAVQDPAIIQVDNSVDAPGVKVGLSGTLTGNGRIELTGPTSLSRTTSVLGTLAPAGKLSIEGDLALESKATTICNVTPQTWDRVNVVTGTSGGHADLAGRLTVIMTGTFTPNTEFILLHAESGIAPNTFFQSESIKYPGCQGFTPHITYDANNVKLHLDIAPTCQG